MVLQGGGIELLGGAMFLGALVFIFTGYPVAFALGGVALFFGAIGIAIGEFDLRFVGSLPQRIFGIMSNYTLLAIPYFIFLGLILEKSKLAEQLLDTVGQLFGPVRGGVAIAVVLVGTLLAATTGVVAATVVAMGLISLPIMLRYGYSKPLATGVIAASGTLGQIIPPSIVLVVLGDQLGVSVGDLFLGALIPGLILSGGLALWVALVALVRPKMAPALPPEARPYQGWELWRRALVALVPPVLLILFVLGSIFFGIATPTEAGAVGAVAAIVMAAAYRRLTWKIFHEAVVETARFTSMVIFILIGATAFSLIFRGLEGDKLVKDVLVALPGGELGFIIFVMLLVFILGFFIDFFEICFIIVPLILPAATAIWTAQAEALQMAGHYDLSIEGFVQQKLLWFGIILAMNLQTSFLTPPFGFALFYLRGVAPPEVKTTDIYRGVIPFIAVQLLVLILVIAFPGLSSWLPSMRGISGG
ncbi:TRAP transporter large permease [Meiothermus rufus]|uniref:TRAP transporter large permease n=1 Tax=Meiothermus rufus TaxID=604332 RepID=UPI0003F911B8|nr:TRAP transporter large permease subunit [Meiothermus rufus]